MEKNIEKNERKEKSNIKKKHVHVRLRFLNFSKVYHHFHCASNFLRPNNQLMFHKFFTMAKNFHDNTTKKTILVSLKFITETHRFKEALFKITYELSGNTNNRVF